MAIELECKLAIPSREPVAERLRALGAEAGEDRFERNWTFDTGHRQLRDRGMLLRIRAFRGRPGAVVTLKRPLSAAAHPEALSRKVKCREEIELHIDAPEAFGAILVALGYHLDWYYEKRRQTFLYRGCKVALDELPRLGCYLEVEGESAEAIHRVLADLGLDPEAHLEGTYRCLYREKFGEAADNAPSVWTFVSGADLALPTK